MLIRVSPCPISLVGLSGRCHLGELARARAEGHRAAAVFRAAGRCHPPVAQQCRFSPHDEADPAFGRALREAAQAGVEVYAYKCRVSEEEVTLIGVDPSTPEPTPPVPKDAPQTSSLGRMFFCVWWVIMLVGSKLLRWHRPNLALPADLSPTGASAAERRQRTVEEQ